MKAMTFLGDSLKRLRALPEEVKHDVGYALDRVQRGSHHSDFRPMPSIGKGVEEIRVWSESGTYRVIYLATLADAVYVLNVFQKKTEATPKTELDLAKKRYTELLRGKND